MLEILLLGPVEARAGTDVLPLGGVKQRALLARLATAGGRSLAPDVLVEDLWGDRPPGDPGHALQAHVSRLRGTLGVPVERNGGGYRLEVGRCVVDATSFVSLSEQGHRLLAEGDPVRAARVLGTALELWRGSPFADLPEVGALRPDAVRLEELRQRTVADRIDADLLCDRHASVVPELQATLSAEPLQERAWRQLIVALARSGRENEALSAYRRARETFVTELGVEPGEQLAALHQAVLVGTGPRRDSAAPATGENDPTAALPNEVSRRLGDPFVGRDHDVAALDRARSRQPTGLRLAVVTGEPGIGKTRLAAEFAARRHAEGDRVLFGRCDESLRVPHQPFLEMLRPELEAGPPETLADRLGPAPGDLARLLPELADRLPPGVPPRPRSDPDTERYRTFDAVAGWLAAASAQRPLLLVLDDLHWADQQTVLLLAHLLRSPRPVRGMVVATFRDREQLQPGAATTALADLLQQAEGIVEVHLEGLPEAAVTDLLAGELDGAGDTGSTWPDLARWARSASGGNPLFLRELGRQVADLSREAGGDPVVVPKQRLPARLRGVVDARLHRLPEAQRQALSYAALIGRQFDAEVLAVAADLDHAALDGLLQQVTYSRLVEQVPGDRLCYAFSHDVVRAVLEDSLPPMRRAEMHLRIAHALEGCPTNDTTRRYGELAHHFSAGATAPGQDTARAVQYLVLAGRSALDQQAPATAVASLRRARDLLPLDADPAVSCDLLTALGIAEFRAGDAAHRETLLAASRGAREAGDVPRLVTAAVNNSRGWWSSTSEVDGERVAMLETALALCAVSDTVARVELLSAWAMENVRDPARRLLAVERSAEAVALARTAEDEELLATALSKRYAVMFASFTDPRGCVDISEELFTLAQRRDDPGLRLQAAIGLAQSTLVLGEATIADRSLEQALGLAEMLNQPARLWLTRGWQVMRSARRGRLEEAEEQAALTLDLGIRTGQPDALTWYAGQLFTLRWLQGRLPELIGEIEAQVSSEGTGIPAWQAAYTLALATVGRHRDATEQLDRFVGGGLATLPHDMLWLHALCYLCQASALVGDTASARVLHDELAPYAGLQAHNGTLDAGPVDLHLGLVAGVLGERDRAAQHLADAEAACRRLDAPLWLARTRAAMRECSG